ncbi:glycosyltransferase family 2 protein [Aestuariimicrobium soli]|uniref:glycosyltransferase family 2 protein n=1 Tax=Aestuariimicrobium soli TaxID=2035834 RepID=UPI003EBED9A4
MSEPWPTLSVVMPVLNEERHLRTSLRGVLDQDYPGDLEIVLALGPSTDRTAEIAAQLAADDPRLVVVENPSGTTPDGLNRAIAASSHDVVVRVDAHGELGPDYLTTAVATLQRTGAANVGGLMDARGTTDFERAVAAAYNSRIGLGGGAFHLADSEEGPAESVFLGCFRREALLRVGGYDPDLRRAQDWELNLRLRESGELVWFTPRLRVTYRPRSTARALAKQFFTTGKWRREVIRRHPQTASARYLAPPLVVLGSAVGLVVGLVGVATGHRALTAALVVPAAYAAGVCIGAAGVKGDLPWRARLRLPAVLAVMHLGWGAGFVRGLTADERTNPDPAPRPTA